MQEERRLQTALASRERVAWSAIYDRHVREVFGLIYHLVGRDRVLAEDINQEVWLAALEGFDHFDATRGRFRDWLIGIARHRVSHHFRGQSRKPLDAAVDEHIQPQDAAIPPPEQLEAIERGDIIRAALLQLNQDYRDVLLKKYVDGFSVVKIAGLTGRSAKAVESLLSRARERFRELLGPYFLHTKQGDLNESAGVKQPCE
jgi:RNA polymerase sigma-70 factor, ECF subfamily